jgi:threonine aldolase
MTPEQIREQVKQVVDVMGSPEGGLMLCASAWGTDVPLRNIEAICDAMEEYCLRL